MKYYLSIFLAIIFFSSIEVVSKHLGQLDPLLFVPLRFAPAGLILLAIGHREFRRVTALDLGALALLGLVGVTISFIAFHTSLQYMTASTATVLASLNPIFSAVTAALLLKERLHWPRIAGVFVCLAGVYIVSFGFGTVTFQTVIGPLLMFTVQITFGFYIAAAKPYIRKYGPFFSTGVAFVVGGLLGVPFVHRWSIPFSVDTVGWLLYLIVAATAFGYVCYFYGLKHVPVAAGTSMFFLKPVIGPTLAVVFLGETLAGHFYIGVIIVLAGLVLSIFGGGPQTAALEAPSTALGGEA